MQDIIAVNECYPMFQHLQESSLFCDDRDETTSTFNEIILDEILERVVQHNFFDREDASPQMLFMVQSTGTIADEYEYLEV